MDDPRLGQEPEPERYELDATPAHVFPLRRRHFLQVTAGGLVVAAAHARGVSQESGRALVGRPDTPDDVAAWLHVAPSGDVTVFTGKVEIGQNIRTSLAQTVADALDVPFDRIALVMGDTGRTPFDNGTYGSQSTPRMAPQLARAARTARQHLLSRAAARWQVDGATLRTQDGHVVAPDGRRVSYGDLATDAVRGEVADDLAPEPRTAWVERGRPRPKVDALAFVTGRHRYTPDIDRPSMLHGQVVRAPRYGAVAARVDLQASRAMPGVVAVHDGAFIGVAAPSPRAAAAAAAAARVQWQEPGGPSITSETLFDALRPAAPPATPSSQGDIDTGRRLSVRTFTRRFHVPYIAHVPLEPRAAVAEWDADGSLTVWTGTQRPFGVRRELAEAFHLPEARVRVIVPDTGAAYGGKHTGEQAIEAARLAKAAGRPVSLRWSRAEEFMWAYFRPAGVIEVEAGVDADGRLVAWRFDNWNSGAAGIRTPYDVPHQAIAFHRAESPLRQGSYRALAATANTFAREMAMDEVARARGEDPLAFRLRHLTEPRLRHVLETVAAHVRWPAQVDGGGWGIACGTEKNSVIAIAAQVSRAPSGFAVERLVAAYECGAIVNPDGLRHQVEGAIVQGLGGALFEAIAFADGRLGNGSLARYRVPRFADVPTIEILLVDRPDRPSDGAGETPIIAVAPAIGSAVRALGPIDDALPVRLRA